MDKIKSKIDSATIILLEGPAGNGKTALEHTIAEICKEEGLLLAAFFFSRTAANCNDGHLLFPSVASQLMRSIPQTKRYIRKAIRRNPHLLTSTLSVQMKELILEPIRRVSTLNRFLKWSGIRSYPILIAIDGLDECADHGVQSNIVELIGNAARDLHLPLRFLIASRPEPHILKAFDKLSARLQDDRLSTLRLTEDEYARRDIKLYLDKGFDNIRRDHPAILSEDWPGLEVVSQLVDKASGQFIYAKTIIAYVASRAESYHRPDERLEVILRALPPLTDKPFEQMNALYSVILWNAKYRARVMEILGLLLAARGISAEPGGSSTTGYSLTHAEIEKILKWKKGDVGLFLLDLHAIIENRESDQYIKVIHASLPDFLTDQARSQELFIDVNRAQTQLLMLANEYSERAQSLLAHLPITFLTSASDDSPSILSSAIALNRATGRPNDFTSNLETLDIWAVYTAFVCSAPWKRRLATNVLKTMCATLAVSMDLSSLCVNQAKIILQECGFPCLHEFDVDARQKAFWSALTWEVVPNSNAADTGLHM